MLFMVHSSFVFAEEKTSIFPGPGAGPTTDFERTHKRRPGGHTQMQSTISFFEERAAAGHQ